MNVRLLAPAQHDHNQNGDELLVIAIAHQHRKPGYWRDRMQSR
jgi:hypothetical protein